MAGFEKLYQGAMTATADNLLHWLAKRGGNCLTPPKIQLVILAKKQGRVHWCHSQNRGPFSPGLACSSQDLGIGNCGLGAHGNTISLCHNQAVCLDFQR